MSSELDCTNVEVSFELDCKNVQVSFELDCTNLQVHFELESTNEQVSFSWTVQMYRCPVILLGQNVVWTFCPDSTLPARTF